MATITKRDLVIKLSNETGLTQQDVFSVLQGALDSITEELAQGNSVVMRNFGAFQVREVKGKISSSYSGGSIDFTSIEFLKWCGQNWLHHFFVKKRERLSCLRCSY